MNQEKYKKITKEIIPNKVNTKKLIIVFISGGLIGVLGQILISIYSSFDSISEIEAGNYMMITLIFIASLLTGIGFFDKLVTIFGAGLIIPITGFAHSMVSSAIEYRKEGLVTGIGTNIFKLAGAVILYGVVSAYFFGIIRYLFFGG